MLAAAGAPQTTVFDTEINYGLEGLGEGKVDLTGENAMALMSRTYIDSVRYGFGSTFWFVWTANPDSKFGIQFTRAATAEQTAWRTTYDWLVGAQFQRCVETQDQVVICQFNKGPENFSIIWRGDVGAAPGQVSSSLVGQLGSRKCDLFSNCDAFSAGTNVAVGPMPIRIDGAPLPASTGTGTDTPTPVLDPGVIFTAAPPNITGVDLVYGPSNKADAAAKWAPPANFDQWQVQRYEYEWKFCDGKCTVISRGTATPFTTNVSQDLLRGPGKYQFAIRAVGTVTSGTPSTGGVGATATTPVASRWSVQTFTVLSSRAAPPGTVELAAQLKAGIISWAAPTIRNVAQYEVQIRNVTKNGRWRSLPSTKKTTVEFTPTAFDMTTGDDIQARVRTVLASGATSTYAPSPVAKVITQLPQVMTPWRVGVMGNCEASTFTVPKPTGFPGEFPDLAAQIRVATPDGGWNLMTYTPQSQFDRLKGDPFTLWGTSTDAKPAANTTLFPLDVRTIGFNNGTITGDCSTTERYEYRLVSGSGDFLPSEWAPVELRGLI
jgi:hypothetical protein